MFERYFCHTDGEDYTNISEELTFRNDGVTSMSVQLIITNDEIGENNEFLTLRINGEDAATVNIMDDGEQILMVKHVTLIVFWFIVMFKT